MKKEKFFISTNGSSGISRDTLEAALKTIKAELEFILESNSNEVIDIEITSYEDEDNMDFYDALDILNDLELDDTAYNYYREALEGICYNDPASYETHGYKSYSAVIEDARRCEENNKEGK